MKGQGEGPTFYGTEIIILILTTAFSYCSSAVLQKSFLSRLGEMNQAKGQSDTMLQKILEVSDAMTKKINGMSDEVRSAIRNRRIGFVFQNFNLLPRANALKNVMVPLLYGEEHSKNGKEHAMEMLKMVGMEDRADH
jgi:putative ABC transport system ATP-binding protein